MFSDEDAKELFQLFPPQKKPGSLPSLILLSSGHGFATRESVEKKFRRRVAIMADLGSDSESESELIRIPVAALASDLDVDPAIVTQLVQQYPGISMLSADRSSIITLEEREALQRKLYSLLFPGIVSMTEYASQNDLDVEGVDSLLSRPDTVVPLPNNHVIGKDYECDAVKIVSRLLQSSLEDLQSVDIVSESLPDTPPTLFIFHIIELVMKSQDLANKFFVQKVSNGVQCYPKQLIAQNRDAVIEDLRSGRLAYVDLQAFWKDSPELYPTYEDAQQYVQNVIDVEIIDKYAVPTAKFFTLEKSSTWILQEEGRLDLVSVSQDFPESLQTRIVHDVERRIQAKFQQEHNAQALRIGNFLLKPETYTSERHVLLDYAEVDASLQWQQLKEDPEKEIKYSLSNITAMIIGEQYILSSLIKERAVEKAVEEQFWVTIAAQEAENEARFSEVWTERVAAKCHIYNDGLASVEDQKLRDQLSELFVTYVKKELVPESVAKAQSQGLVLSRKTRKNISMLHSALQADTMVVSSILSALKKFSKKQGVDSLDDAKLLEAKQAMVNDMIRRMQKQKPSDGPVLFLTLTLVLFTKQYDGVVYATGKFAPKLLKQLKSVLSAEQYAQVEKWKEAAKTSTLSAEDRAEMKKMAEASDSAGLRIYR